tara:strand:- start:183 stop:1280 length:1098 start_codon:yes stop_codon:yes gene_type:complete
MPVVPGDPAPVFRARETINPNYAFSSAAGRNIVLCFIDSAEKQRNLCVKLAKLPYFDDRNACLFFITPTPEDEHNKILPLRIPGVRAFYDDNREIENLYGVNEADFRPVIYVLSPRLQVIGLFGNAGTDHMVNRVDQTLRMLDKPSDMPPLLQHAPIMVIPHVFEADLCEKLISYYNTNESYESGFMRDVGGKTKEIHDYNHKRRRDVELEPDEPLIKIIQNRFQRRVVPEIQKNYQFDVTRMERYIVACYDEKSGGYFRPHRDNTTKGTAHRRFAISLNLNSEDYDGGDLRFPEYGQRTYRAPTGGCVVFSCSLLHEATPITRGTRYAFLPFLYDEAAKKIREENLEHLDDEIENKNILKDQSS